MKEIEIWADSFHEGLWALENLEGYFECKEKQYIHNFIPFFRMECKPNEDIDFKVYGSYQSWSPIPEVIKTLLSYGKPDIVFYDRVSNTIILAIEETAAVPTGNQALQRCERVYGAAKLKVPFVYLIGEFGVHTDGAVRRTSIWPTLLGLKLALQFQTPSFSLHYSDSLNPEDYDSGTGLGNLFEYASLLILENYSLLSDDDSIRLIDLQKNMVDSMVSFISDQYENMIEYFPWCEYLESEECTLEMSKHVAGKNSRLDNELMVWPTTEILYKEVPEYNIQSGLIAPDEFLGQIEKLILNKKAYHISKGAGSRPQKGEKINEWISWHQDRTAIINEVFNKRLYYNRSIRDFPKSPSGLYHLTTSKNITYLIDSLSDLENCFEISFTRNISLVNILERNKDLPIFLYVSNALKQNRIFGDPYTGQFATFASIFSYDHLRKKTRLSIMYLPHTSAASFFGTNGSLAKNKGMRIYLDMADLIITNSGYIVTLQNGGKIYD